MQIVEYLKNKVSQRIKALNSYIPEGAIVYDIACDHGLIGIYAFYVRNAAQVYLVDSSSEVIEKLKLAQQKFFSDNDAIHIIKKRAEDIVMVNGEKYCILAGIGDQTIISILKNWKIQLNNDPLHLIICSQNRKNDYPSVLLLENYKLCSEQKLSENNQDYLIQYWQKTYILK